METVSQTFRFFLSLTCAACIIGNAQAETISLFTTTCSSIPIPLCDSITSTLEHELIGLKKFTVIPQKSIAQAPYTVSSDSGWGVFARDLGTKYLLLFTLVKTDSSYEATYTLYDTLSTSTIETLQKEYTSFQTGLESWCVGMMYELVSEKILIPAAELAKTQGKEALGKVELGIMKSKEKKALIAMRVTGIASAISITAIGIAILLMNSGFGR